MPPTQVIYLAPREDQVVTKGDLLAHVWQIPYVSADKTVDVHLSWLRRKLGETALEPRYLHTVRRVGIRLSAPVEPNTRSPAAHEAPGHPGDRAKSAGGHPRRACL